MFCANVKEFLSQRNIEFIEHDVTKDNDALTELKVLGVMTTPVIKINGEIVVGFNQARLEQLLNLQD